MLQFQCLVLLRGVRLQQGNWWSALMAADQNRLSTTLLSDGCSSRGSFFLGPTTWPGRW